MINHTFLQYTIKNIAKNAEVQVAAHRWKCETISFAMVSILVWESNSSKRQRAVSLTLLLWLFIVRGKKRSIRKEIRRSPEPKSIVQGPFRFWFVAALQALTVIKRDTLTNSIIIIIILLRPQGFIQYIWNQPSLSITPTARLGKFEKLRSCYHLSLWFVMAFRAHIMFCSLRQRKVASNGRKLCDIPFSKRENDG